jgi:hypothetical protein
MSKFFNFCRVLKNFSNPSQTINVNFLVKLNSETTKYKDKAPKIQKKTLYRVPKDNDKNF